MEAIRALTNNNYRSSINYEKSLSEDMKKSMGIYYTPKFIIDYILTKTIKQHDILSNPYPKILDISCGCGNFLLEVYDILYDMFEEHRYELKIEDIHKHILENCIYGVDIDKNAIDMLKSTLENKDKSQNFIDLNIYCFDSLNKDDLDQNIIEIFWEGKFDYIVGNPPYIGHKNLKIDYKKWLLKEYSEVYRDKGDIYFCFYKRIIDLLSEVGMSSIITPRYFLESPSGKCLRNYMLKNSSIREIIDFNGANVFKNINVASCIITLNKFSNNSNIEVYKLENLKLDFQSIDSLDKYINNNFSNIKINQNDLNEDWIIANKTSIDIYNKIESYAKYSLKDICTSFQGIITGCDKAFVIDKNKVDIGEYEPSILKKWIKNKQINKYKIDESQFALIYSDDIKDEINYPNSISYIAKHKDKLINRRECKKNTRKWYELQWGREKGYFERKKIMYPYKSTENKFAIDYDNRYCSADIYSFYINKEFEEEFSYEYIVGILNSKIYDTYFKTFAKKMTSNLYDYYPNKIMNIKIFKDKNYLKIENLSKDIIKLLNQDNYIYEEIENKQKEIDKLISQSIQLNSLR